MKFSAIFLVIAITFKLVSAESFATISFGACPSSLPVIPNFTTDAVSWQFSSEGFEIWAEYLSFKISTKEPGTKSNAFQTTLKEGSSAWRTDTPPSTPHTLHQTTRPSNQSKENLHLLDSGLYWAYGHKAFGSSGMLQRTLGVATVPDPSAPNKLKLAIPITLFGFTLGQNTVGWILQARYLEDLDRLRWNFRFQRETTTSSTRTFPPIRPFTHAWMVHLDFLSWSTLGSFQELALWTLRASARPMQHSPIWISTSITSLIAAKMAALISHHLSRWWAFRLTSFKKNYFSIKTHPI